MKKYINGLSGVTLIAMVFFLNSCNKQTLDMPADQLVSPDVLQKIADRGFSTLDVKPFEDYYVVEGDILLNREELTGEAKEMRVPNMEQYHTFNLVRAPRTISIRMMESMGSDFSQATDIAIARYNAEDLALKFVRTNRKNADIVIAPTPGTSLFAYAGFPSKNGKPFNAIRISTLWFAYDADINMLASLVAHEIGHCIGFRHTDWFNRCGGGANEGQETDGIGAVHIPGTSQAPNPDPDSWMLSCFTSIGPAGNRPFTADDKTALDYLY